MVSLTQLLLGFDVALITHEYDSSAVSMLCLSKAQSLTVLHAALKAASWIAGQAVNKTSS
jgi:hypothetical protein